jgi:hypothetical protein
LPLKQRPALQLNKAFWSIVAEHPHATSATGSEN